MSATSDVAVAGHAAHEPSPPPSPLSLPPSLSEDERRSSKHTRRDSGYAADMLVPQPFHPDPAAEAEARMDAAARLGALLGAVDAWRHCASGVRSALAAGEDCAPERERMDDLWGAVQRMLGGQ